jgi:hypothetical protein
MRVNIRREQRRNLNGAYSLCWEEDGVARSVEAQGVDISQSGMRLRASCGVPEGARVFIEGRTGRVNGHAFVRHCDRDGDGCTIGLEFLPETKKTVEPPAPESTDYYEFLQVSPSAEAATIHRVYRFMASRLHPDNPETGDAEKFVRLNRAYEALSDPERRAAYDAAHRPSQAKPIPIFESSAFVNGVEGEANRRLGVLSLLYHRRRTNPRDARVSLLDLEKQMGFPREYLDFTTWYLKSKQYIAMEDNSDFSLTALGVDYVEANATSSPILHQLLTAGACITSEPGASAAGGSDGSSGGREMDAFQPLLSDGQTGSP